MGGKVSAGDPVRRLSAGIHNATLDLIKQHKARRHDRGTGEYGRSGFSGVVLAKNESGQDRDRFDILGIGGPITNVTENAAEFESRITVIGAQPGEQHRGRFVVLLGALPDAEIGRAIMAGPCVVRVKMLNEAHQRADVRLDSAATLESNESGSALLSWVQPVDERDDPEIAWCIAVIGSPGTPPARARITGYGGPSDSPTHYMGKLIDANGDDVDPEGEPIDLWCRKGVPSSGDSDIRLFLPRLLATGYADTVWDVRWSVEDGGRWFIDTFFVPWCEAEGVPGSQPDLMPPPAPPGDFPLPGDPRALEERWMP